MNHWIDSKTTRLSRQKDALVKDIQRLETDFNSKIQKLYEAASTIGEVVIEVQRGTEAYKAHVDRLTNAETRRLKKRIKDLEAELEALGSVSVSKKADHTEICKAKTVAILDSILFNISNWSQAGDTAPDFELASQAVLFPAVYEKLSGPQRNEYVLDEVPPAALEIVRRGREYVRYFRETCHLSLVEPSTWESSIEEIRSWWINDALPLIYGERSPEWDDDAPFSLQEMIAWRDFPANRPLGFPLIFDAMEAVEKYRDEIREETGIPRFNKEAITTRLEVSE